MLTPEYMAKVNKTILKYYLNTEKAILKDIGKALSEALEDNRELTPTERHKIEVLYRKGYSRVELEKELKKLTKLSRREIDRLIMGAARQSYANDKYLYKLGEKELREFKDNKQVLKQIRAYQRQARKDLDNITNTLGLQGMKIKDYYNKELTKSVMKIKSGAYSKQEVYRKTINDLARSGLQSINYASGRNYSVESAVRTTINTALNQLTAEISEMNADEMGQDLMEITAHSGARPSHKEWQGQVVSRSGKPGYLTLDHIGYGRADGFMGVNCRHNWYPYFEGISVPAWSKADLENIDPPDFKYKGKNFTAYEATQRQRSLERDIRTQKRKLALLSDCKHKDIVNSEKAKLKALNKEYTKFSQVAGIRKKTDRLQIGK